MGTGKSAVGRLLAETLHFQFLDTDDLLEERAGKSVSRIFEEGGRKKFREQESHVVEGLQKLKRAVIATGGGVGADEKNLASLKQHALVVCLWASPEIIWSRVGTQTHRPLLQTANPQKKICELLKARERFYRQADVLVNTEVRSDQRSGATCGARIPFCHSSAVKNLVQEKARELGFDACRFTNAAPPDHAAHFQNWLDAERHGEMNWLNAMPKNGLTAIRLARSKNNYFVGRELQRREERK